MRRPRIVIIGSGFAGFQAARRLHRLVGHQAQVVVVSSTNYFLYLPLLPQVASGVLDPRRVAVSLRTGLRGVPLVVGEVNGIDLDRRRISFVNQEDEQQDLEYDRLLVTVGSVNKLLPVPGVAEHAHGFRSLPEALYLRDHIIRQMELAAVSGDRAERAARCTFVVVGAGYTGTEVAAHGQLLTRDLARMQPRLRHLRPRWLLLDIADRVLPELDPRLSRTATAVLRRRGVEIRVGTSVREAYAGGVRLSGGEDVATRTLVWCVGVRPDPLVESLGLPTRKGRLAVDEYLTVPGHPEVFACGDAAAVPDLTRPGEITPMTAQHAVRQGRTAADNLAASLGIGHRRAYRHRSLGFVVDLGGLRAAANPLGVPLPSPLAAVVAYGYHLVAMPANRLRVVADWAMEAVQHRQAVQLGLVRAQAVPLDTAAPELVQRR